MGRKDKDMKQIRFGLLLLWAQALPALADGGVPMPAKALPAYAQECAACHLAYPPGLLPAASWNRVMAGLSNHYGADASLDARQVQDISAWLQANAGTYKKARNEPPQDRITRASWFVREHREVPPEVWKLPSVKSASQCAACHTGAEQGRLDEHALRAPAGMKGRFQ
jgi:mono/diheme cytochrome c family protein